jgi:PLATZ transcription factor
MYHDVVRVEEFEKLFNCSSVQVRAKNKSLLLLVL